MAKDRYKRLFLRDPRNMERFKPGVSPPRLSFAGFVDFKFNEEIIIGNKDILKDTAQYREQISSLLQTSSLPSVQFKTEVKNQYNIKRIINTAVDYQPIEMTVLDTVNNDWLLLLMRYFSYLYMNPRNKTDGATRSLNPKGYESSEKVLLQPSDFMSDSFDSNAAGLDLSETSNFFSWIKLVVFHAGRGTEYILFRPKITAFSFGNIDFTSSDTRKFNMTFDYENFTVNNHVNFKLNNEDLLRFENLGDSITWYFDELDMENTQNNPIYGGAENEDGRAVQFLGNEQDPVRSRTMQALTEPPPDAAADGDMVDSTETAGEAEEAAEEMPVEDAETKTKKGSKFRALVGAAVGAATAAASGGNPLAGAAAGAAAGAVTGGGLGAAAKNAAGAGAVAGAISGNDAKAIAEAAAVQAASTLISGAIGRVTGGGGSDSDSSDSSDSGSDSDSDASETTTEGEG